MLTAAVILLLASSLTALFTALVMADHERNRLTLSMENDRDALSRGLLMAMEVRGKELERFSRNPLLYARCKRFKPAKRAASRSRLPNCKANSPTCAP